MMLLGSTLLCEKEFVDAGNVFRQVISALQRLNHNNNSMYFFGIKSFAQALLKNPAGVSYDELIEVKTILEAELPRARLLRMELKTIEIMQMILDHVPYELAQFPHRIPPPPGAR